MKKIIALALALLFAPFGAAAQQPQRSAPMVPNTFVPLSLPASSIVPGTTVVTGGATGCTVFANGTPPTSIGCAVPPISSARRTPNLSDDSTRGYAAGAIWGYACSAWTNGAATAGHSYWSPLGQKASPLGNQTSAAPLGIYGSVKLVSTYAGNAFQVTRASDSTTLAVGFVSGLCGVQVANYAASDVFCAGTTCGYSIIYDQSGNGYDLAQATAANQPGYNNNTINGFRVISIDGCNCATTVARMMTNASIPTSARGMSTFFIGRPTFGADSNTFIDFQASPTGSNDLAFWTDGSSNTDGLKIHAGGSTLVPSPDILAQSSPSVWGFVSGTSGVTFYNGTSATATLAELASNSYTGVTLGNLFWSGAQVSFREGQFDFLVLAVYGSAISNADVATIQAAAAQQFGITPQLNDNVVLVGDSISRGGAASNNLPFAMQMQASFGRPLQVYNYGISGYTLQNWVAHWSGNVPPLVNAGNLSIAVIQAGSNDIQNSTSAAAIEGYVQTLCADAHAAAMSCVVASIISRGSFSGAQETVRQTYNSWLRANWPSFADGFADPGGDPLIGCASCNSNLTYFSSDQTHPTTVGHSIETGYFVNAINGLNSVLWSQ